MFKSSCPESDHIESRHQTLRLATRAQRKYTRDFIKNNPPGNGISYLCRYCIYDRVKNEFIGEIEW